MAVERQTWCWRSSWHLALHPLAGGRELIGNSRLPRQSCHLGTVRIQASNPPKCYPASLGQLKATFLIKPPDQWSGGYPGVCSPKIHWADPRLCHCSWWLVTSISASHESPHPQHFSVIVAVLELTLQTGWPKTSAYLSQSGVGIKGVYHHA